MISLICALRLSISALREKTPTRLAAEPPVIEPPGLITCPSSVTIFRRYPASAGNGKRRVHILGKRGTAQQTRG